MYGNDLYPFPEKLRENTIQQNSSNEKFLFFNSRYKLYVNFYGVSGFLVKLKKLIEWWRVLLSATVNLTRTFSPTQTLATSSHLPWSCSTPPSIIPVWKTNPRSTSSSQWTEELTTVEIYQGNSSFPCKNFLFLSNSFLHQRL